ncbi:endonuclease [Devosia yakushimensis]|uniref:Endonuclease n=1 Tax=Devosia yakushimensis TaxID=470028 RepID=A0ABQ5UFB7_9HYPH|nr:endonuclease domain-containing protein [Devosia yakushimensis]GLQ10176.1 endonuclease [Devosia yakushimensis]
MSSTTPARRLRLDQTPAERRFWAMLHTFRQSGWHFRRQAPIGPYIVDFACKRARLIFEIDGDSHFSDAGIAADRIRTQYLESRGYRVVRFTNHEVMTSGDGVYILVSQILDKAGDTPS